MTEGGADEQLPQVVINDLNHHSAASGAFAFHEVVLALTQYRHLDAIEALAWVVTNLIDEHDTNVQSLASKMGYTSSTHVKRIAKGRENITFRTLAKLAKAFDLTTLELLAKVVKRMQDRELARRDRPWLDSEQSHHKRLEFQSSPQA